MDQPPRPDPTPPLPSSPPAIITIESDDQPPPITAICSSRSSAHSTPNDGTHSIPVTDNTSSHQVAQDSDNPLRINEIPPEISDQPQSPHPPALRLSSFSTDVERQPYTGYVPKTTEDFIFRTNINKRPSTLSLIPAAPIPLDDRRSHPIAIPVIIISVIVAIVVLILGLTPASCRLALCDKPDRSSVVSTAYLFKPFDFTAPLTTALVSLFCPLLAIAALFFLLRLLLSAPVPRAPLSILAAHIRHDALTFFSHVSIISCIVSIPIFILIGFASTWSSAVAFLFGLVPTLCAAGLALSVTTRAAPRIATILPTSIFTAFSCMQRAAAVPPLAAFSLTFASLLLTYIILRDVRALPGFVLGTALPAFLLRAFTAVYTAFPVKIEAAPFRHDDERHPAAPWPSASAHVACVAAHTAHLCLCFVAPVVAVAVLASSLPYFENSPYALCVYNHLSVDSRCTAYRPLTSIKQSFAVSLCRLGNFYNQYPSWTPSQSNTLFVRLPFLFAVQATVLTLGSAIFSLRSPRDPRGRIDTSQDTGISRKAILPFVAHIAVHVIVGAVIATISTAALCFGLFGSNSSFYNGQMDSMPRYELSANESDVILGGAGTICSPTTSPAIGLVSGEFPALVLTSSKYRPMNVHGHVFPPGEGSAWRMFVCLELGLVCGLGVASLCGATTSSVHKGARRVAMAADEGVMDELGIGTAISVIVGCVGAFAIVACVGISYATFRAYGVGLCAIGAMYVVGQMGSFCVVGMVGREVRRMCVMAGTETANSALTVDGGGHQKGGDEEWKDMIRRADLLSKVGESMEGWGLTATNVASMMGSLALVWVLMQHTGLAPSGRELGGETVTSEPLRHVTDVDHVNMLNAGVLSATVAGLVLPFAVWGMVITAGYRVSEAAGSAVEREMGRRGVWEEAGVGGYGGVRDAVGRLAGLEGLGVVGVTLAVSVVGGFVFGRRGWVAMGVGALASGGVLSLCVGVAGVRSAGIRLVRVAGEEVGWDRGVRSAGGDWDEVGGVEWMSGCISALLLLVVSVGVVAVKGLPVDGRRWWVGVIVAAMVTVAGGVLVFARKKVAQALDDDGPQLDGGDDGNIGGEKRVDDEVRLHEAAHSPFYEHGAVIERAMIGERSALRHVGVDDIAQVSVNP